MRSAKPDPTIYTSLPPDPTPPQNYVVLHYSPHPPLTRHPYLRRILLPFSLLLLISLLIFLLFPSDPHLQLARVKLNHIRVNSDHHHHNFPTLDLSLNLTVKVRNPNFFSLDYDSLGVAISYRGRELGFVKSNGGKVNAIRSSYVDATLVVDGFEVLHDVFYLIQDVANGNVPFDTVSKIDGQLGLFLLNIPIEGKVSCEVDVNPKDQTIVHQNCFPE